jgi:hypothetical protein
MTKEEILNQRQLSISCGDFRDSEIFIAMEEYAKQEAIGFAKFTMDKTLQDCNTDDKWTLEYFSEITDEQLYKLYLKSKTTQ